MPPPSPQCNINISAPRPSVVKSVTALSYQYTTFDIPQQQVYVVIDYLSLKWKTPSNPNAKLEDLRYEVWVGSKVTSQLDDSNIWLLEDVRKVGNEVRLVTIKQIMYISNDTNV